MKSEDKLYRAIIWVGDRPGLRVSIWAENLEDAKKQLEADHGKGHVFTLHNEEDAEKPR